MLSVRLGYLAEQNVKIQDLTAETPTLFGRIGTTKAETEGLIRMSRSLSRSRRPIAESGNEKLNSKRR